MLLRHYLERGVSKMELSRRFGVSRRTIHEWIETGQLDRDLAGGVDAVQAEACGGFTKLGPVQGDHRGTPGGVPAVVGEAAVRRGSWGGLHGRVCPCEGLRSGGAAAGAGGSGGSIRDAGGAAGTGGPWMTTAVFLPPKQCLKTLCEYVPPRADKDEGTSEPFFGWRIFTDRGGERAGTTARPCDGFGKRLTREVAEP